MLLTNKLTSCFQPLPFSCRPLYCASMLNLVLCFTGFRKKDELVRLLFFLWIDKTMLSLFSKYSSILSLIGFNHDWSSYEGSELFVLLFCCMCTGSDI